MVEMDWASWRLTMSIMVRPPGVHEWGLRA
jgi:hypothetical protein